MTDAEAPLLSGEIIEPGQSGDWEACRPSDVPSAASPSGAPVVGMVGLMMLHSILRRRRADARWNELRYRSRRRR